MITTHFFSFFHANKFHSLVVGESAKGKSHISSIHHPETFSINSPQKGIPSGAQVPPSQTRREGPSSSKPLSQVYVATAPLPRFSSENVTWPWAGAPGKLHDGPPGNGRKGENNRLDGLQVTPKIYLKSCEIIVIFSDHWLGTLTPPSVIVSRRSHRNLLPCVCATWTIDLINLTRLSSPRSLSFGSCWSFAWVLRWSH